MIPTTDKKRLDFGTKLQNIFNRQKLNKYILKSSDLYTIHKFVSPVARFGNENKKQRYLKMGGLNKYKTPIHWQRPVDRLMCECLPKAITKHICVDLYMSMKYKV